MSAVTIRAVAALLVAAVLAACGLSGPQQPRAEAAFRTDDCPDRVTAEILTPVTCGWVSVPERHRAPDGPQIRLFVARILPVQEVSGEPAMYLGYDVGGTVEYGSMATLAPRIHREVIILDTRGTGFSTPHLGCPEVAAAAPRIVALPSGDSSARTAYRNAVTACHQRLTDAGVDVSAYGLDEVPADVEAVMKALAIPTVTLFTAGTSSRLQLAVLRRAKEGSMRVAVLDNGPSTPTPDDVLATAALQEALLGADHLCDAACDETGRPSEQTQGLAQQLDDAPVAASTGDGHPLLLDGTRLRGIAAWWLERHLGGARLSLELAAAAAGQPRTGPLDTAERVLCLGHRPKCEAPDFAYGVWWTVRCRDQAAQSGGFQADVCAQWPVGRSSDEYRTPVKVSVPVLALYGGMNPYVPASERTLPGVTRRTVVVDPVRGQDVVLGCVRPWRDQWVDDPTIEPVGLCPAAMPGVTGTKTWAG